MKRIILASSSPRRKEILAMTSAVFDVVPSEYEEDNALNLPPNKLVEHLALGKARWVADRNRDAVVIGADTLVFLDGKAIGKQRDRGELMETLTALSGKSHSVISGFSIVGHDRAVTESVETKVFFRSLGRDEIERYADTADWQDKAAGYGIQSAAALFIEKIEGDYFNVVGLPLCRLAVRLKEFDIDLQSKDYSK